MRKLVIALLLTFAMGLVLSSCSSSRGPKCPGMYSKVKNVEQQKNM
jgi:hypothetical protein